ncbi:MAG: DinB family protein [Chitinophagaceae bacterium]
MNKSIEIIKETRNNFLKLIDSLPIDILNKVPAGFNNNIIWNFGHVVISQQLLCYKLSGATMLVDEAMIPKYSKGTKPDGVVSQEEIDQLKAWAVETIDQTEHDLEGDVFQNYKTYTTSFGTTLENVGDAIQFVAMHEGLHLGYAMALKNAAQ